MPPEPNLCGSSFESAAVHAASHALYIKPIWQFEVEGLWREAPYCSFHCGREKGKKNKKRGSRVEEYRKVPHQANFCLKVGMEAVTITPFKKEMDSSRKEPLSVCHSGPLFFQSSLYTVMLLYPLPIIISTSALSGANMRVKIWISYSVEWVQIAKVCVL